MRLVWILLLSLAAKFAASSSANVTSAADSLQIYENEVFVQGTWRAPSRRWTYADNGQAAESPNQLQPPSSSTEFMEDWKIVKTTASDKFGWEYFVAQPYPKRRRLWWRSYRLVITESTRRRSSELRLLPQSWLEDFNFKGYELTLYKSFMFPESVGMAWRLPLTYSFDIFDRMPGLPSVSVAGCAFYPSMVYVGISVSMRVEALRHAAAYLLQSTKCLILLILWTLLRGVALAASAVLFPVTKRLYQLPFPASWQLDVEPVIYSRTVQERFGASISWRYTPTQGFYKAVRYWHSYSLTVAHLLSSQQSVPAWVARYAAQVGLSSGGWIPDIPHLFASVYVSLSGIYWRLRPWWKRRRQRRLANVKGSRDHSTLDSAPQEPLSTRSYSRIEAKASKAAY